MIIPKLFTAEYSISQNCFHIQQLREMIDYNLRCSINQFKDDWHLIGVFDNEIDAHIFIEKMREPIQGKEMADKFKQSASYHDDTEVNEN
jgi:hypothetical protein